MIERDYTAKVSRYQGVFEIVNEIACDLSFPRLRAEALRRASAEVGIQVEGVSWWNVGTDHWSVPTGITLFPLLQGLDPLLQFPVLVLEGIILRS
jgi:hypothetical protein